MDNEEKNAYISLNQGDNITNSYNGRMRKIMAVLTSKVYDFLDYI